MSSFKILFICGSFENGKDGIGDYTRKLAIECIQHQVQVAVLALYDGYVGEAVFTENPFPLLRISSGMESSKRQLKSLDFKDTIKPDWISIQFMPYALNSRGIVFSQITFFKQLTQGMHVHMMLHELWIGEELGADIKNKLVGFVQRWSVISFLKKVNPSVIHASLAINIRILKRYHIAAHKLPLFGNIAVSSNLNFSKLYWEVQKVDTHFTQESRPDYVLFGLFGTLYNNWNLTSLFEKIKSDPSIAAKKKMVLSIGEIGKGIHRWNELKIEHHGIEFVLLGRRSEEEISQFLQFIDFGIATTPPLLLGKSGSYLAMAEHGLPVICDKNKFRFNFELNPDLNENDCVIVDDAPINFSMVQRKKTPESNLKSVTQQFLKDLKIKFN